MPGSWSDFSLGALKGAGNLASVFNALVNPLSHILRGYQQVPISDAQLGGAAAFEVLATVATFGTTSLESAAARGASSAINALRLEKQLASEAQAAEILFGGGTTMAGAGVRRQIDVLARLLQEYGGKAADWVKVTSSAFRTSKGELIETHAYVDLASGEVVELKTVITRP